MRIEVNDTNRVIAVFTWKEITERNISEAELKEPQNGKVSLLIDEIIEQASQIGNFRPSKGFMRCSIFSLPPLVRVAIKNSEREEEIESGAEQASQAVVQEEMCAEKKNGTVLWFDSIDTLFALSGAFSFTGSSSLYGEKETGYFLILKQENEKERYCPSLVEFSVRKANKSAEYVMEHFPVLIREKAIETLRKI